MVQNNYFYISRSEFWAYYLNSRHAEELLKKNVKESLRKELFNEYVAVMNIETSAFCNRRCSYCPVSYYPREQRFMDDSLFIKIISEMRDIDYRGIFTLSLFNEPLADRDILRRIKTIKDYCPNSYVRMNSNGDYLSKDFLDELNAVGLNEILVTLHLNVGEQYTDELSKKKIEQFFAKLGLIYSITRQTSMHNISCDLNYRNIRLLVVTNNWIKDGTDRGGEIKELSIENRIQPCATPFREVIIDVDGNVRFCWNIFINADYIGNVCNLGVLDIYFSDAMVDIRRNHLCFGEKNSPCKTCNTYDNALETSVKMREKLLSSASIE